MSWLATIFFCLVCYGLGWHFAHTTVADECKKLGKFYVGDEVFECTKIRKKEG